MENKITYEDFYNCILNYIEVVSPSNKDTIEFLGALLHSVFDTIKMDKKDKIFYLEIYNKLIVHKLKNFDKELIAN